jgi:hypothetical protein
MTTAEPKSFKQKQHQTHFGVLLAQSGVAGNKMDMVIQDASYLAFRRQLCFASDRVC